MNFEPVFLAPLAIQIHVATVLPAAVLGMVVFAMRKGTARHKMLGKIWLALMVVAAISSFFIHEIRMVGDFSPIHLISIMVIFYAFMAIRAVRRGDIKAHRSYVSGMYLGGIVGAGVFTLLPGRMMNGVVLGGMGFSGLRDMHVFGMLVAVLLFFALGGYFAIRARMGRV